MPVLTVPVLTAPDWSLSFCSSSISSLPLALSERESSHPSSSSSASANSNSGSSGNRTKDAKATVAPVVPNGRRLSGSVVTVAQSPSIKRVLKVDVSAQPPNSSSSAQSPSTEISIVERVASGVLAARLGATSASSKASHVDCSQSSDDGSNSDQHRRRGVYIFSFFFVI